MARWRLSLLHQDSAVTKVSPRIRTGMNVLILSFRLLGLHNIATLILILVRSR